MRRWLHRKTSDARSCITEEPPAVPAFGYPFLEFTYSRVEIRPRTDHASIRAERRTFKDGGMTVERFEGSLSPALYFDIAASMQRQMLDYLEWMRFQTSFLCPWLPPPSSDEP